MERHFTMTGAMMVVVGLLAAPMMTACSPARSEASFCKALSSGNDKMRTNTNSASSDSMGQFKLIFENLSDYNNMVHELDERAPEEIKQDMHSAREAWDRIGSTMRDSGGDYLKAMASLFATGMMAGPSFAAVDDYARSHCGSAVFGMSGSTSIPGSDSTSGATPSPTVPAVCSEVEESGWYALTGSSITDMIEAADGSDALREAVEQLSDAPRSAREAMARARLANPDLADDIDTVTRGIKSLCGGVTLSGTEPDDIYGPSKVEGGYLDVQAVLGLCEPQGLVVRGDMMLVACLEDATASFYTVNLSDASVQSHTVSGNVKEVAVLEDAFLALSISEKEASGLDKAATTVTLTVVSPDGDKSEKKIGDFAVPANDMGLKLEPATTQAFVSSQGGDVEKRWLFDAETSKLTQAEMGYSGDEMLYRVYSGDAGPIDGNGAMNKEGKRIGEIRAGGYDPCNRGLLVVTEDRESMAILRPDGSVTPVSPGDSSGDNDLTAAGIWSGRDETMRSTSGKVLWKLPEDVAVSEWTAYGWVVVENKAGERVVVNPWTGKEASELSSAAKEIVTARHSGKDKTGFDKGATTITAEVARDGDGKQDWVTITLPKEEVCAPTKK